MIYNLKHVFDFKLNKFEQNSRGGDSKVAKV